MIEGLHHVTALASAAQANLDFYVQALRMRLVKRTVNFDDPATHHFYYSTATASRAPAPGTLATFFPWGHFRAGRKGSGQVVAFALAVPDQELRSLRPDAAEAIGARSESRLGDNVLRVRDPDGIAVELVAATGSRRLHSVTLCESQLEPTADLLAFLGFAPAGQEGNRTRFALPAGPGFTAEPGFIDVLHEPSAQRGRMGAGAIHHVALRVTDEAAQLDWRARLLARGIQVSPVKDRVYFHSIYFREPGGVLFEIATDGPGFLIDEAESELGSSLRLPPWLEPLRESLEPRLSAIHLGPVPALGPAALPETASEISGGDVRLK